MLFIRVLKIGYEGLLDSVTHVYSRTVLTLLVLLQILILGVLTYNFE